MKILVNLSNHPSESWDEKQKEGWDKIVDIPFPDVDPHLEDVGDLVLEYFKKIREIQIQNNRDSTVYVHLAGEYSFCYELFRRLKDFYLFAVPTSERIVKETVLPDGRTEKTIIFQFVKWRIV